MIKRVFKLFQIARKLSTSGAIDVIRIRYVSGAGITNPIYLTEMLNDFR